MTRGGHVKARHSTEFRAIRPVKHVKTRAYMRARQSTAQHKTLSHQAGEARRDTPSSGRVKARHSTKPSAIRPVKHVETRLRMRARQSTAQRKLLGNQAGKARQDTPALPIYGSTRHGTARHGTARACIYTLHIYIYMLDTATHVHIRVHVHKHFHTRTHIHIHTHTHIYVHMHVHVHVHVHVHI